MAFKALDTNIHTMTLNTTTKKEFIDTLKYGKTYVAIKKHANLFCKTVNNELGGRHIIKYKTQHKLFMIKIYVTVADCSNDVDIIDKNLFVTTYFFPDIVDPNQILVSYFFSPVLKHANESNNIKHLKKQLVNIIRSFISVKSVLTNRTIANHLLFSEKIH